MAILVIYDRDLEVDRGKSSRFQKGDVVAVFEDSHVLSDSEQAQPFRAVSVTGTKAQWDHSTAPDFKTNIPATAFKYPHLLKSLVKDDAGIRVKRCRYKYTTALERKDA